MNDSIMSDIGGKPDRVLVMDIRRFCADMIGAVREWYAAAQDDPIVQENLPRVVRLRPEGAPPWIVGMPVIA